MSGNNNEIHEGVNKKRNGFGYKLYENEERNEIVKNDLNVVISDLYYLDNELKGICKFYKMGMIDEIRTYAKNEGKEWSTYYKDYKEMGYYHYVEDKKYRYTKSTVLQDYWDIVDTETNLRIRCCKLDDNRRAFGEGYVFTDGKLSKIVEYENDEEISVIKAFDSDEDDKLAYDVFENDLVSEDFGEMKEEIVDGELVYYGEWKDGQRHGRGRSYENGLVVYDGEWRNNVAEGHGVIVKNDIVFYEGEWKNGLLQVSEFEHINTDGKSLFRIVDIEDSHTLHELMKDATIKNTIEEMTLSNCNHKTIDLEISGFCYLETIIVKNKSFKSLQKLKICNNDSLRIVKIKSKSFTNVKCAVIESMRRI